MKYILDFDRTLFNSPSFVKRVEMDGRRDVLITPQVWQTYKVQDFLYDDVLTWFNNKDKDNLYILTAISPQLGNQSEAFQREKLRSSGFGNLVSGIHFVVGEKGEKAAEMTVFVDDKIEQCLSVKNYLPNSFCFLMVRNRELIGSAIKEVRGIKVVHNLNEVDAIIDSI